MMNYYNDFDVNNVAWLRELIAARHIPEGYVDGRSITDVSPADLTGYRQCHFFAGIAGWPLAFKLAGIPDDFPAWSGSAPCQPYSIANANAKGNADERNLAPAFKRLVAQCQPAIVFGEQVKKAIEWGWLDDLFVYLEGQGYACGAAVLPACSIGAFHQRDRILFGAVRLANPEGVRALWEICRGHAEAASKTSGNWEYFYFTRRFSGAGRSVPDGILAYRNGAGRQGRIRKGKWSTDTLDVTAQLAMPCRLLASGVILTGSDAKMENSGQLNPAHPRWLMGYPKEWDEAAFKAWQSNPRQRKE